jgi:hypothetical protein
MTPATQDVHRRLSAAFQESDEIEVAIHLGSAAAGRDDEYSDLDYFLYASEPNWPRARTLKWLRQYDLIPSLCYWSGVEKYHMVIEHVGVDYSIRGAAQVGEAATWPTIHFPESAILKDRRGNLRKALLARDPRSLTAGPENTLHGCLYHALNCAIQLRRGELINARMRFSGVVETYICVIENTMVGDILWREPSRRVESRLPAAAIEELRRLAYVGSPLALGRAIREVLRTCASRTETTPTDLETISAIYDVLGPLDHH